MKFSVSDIVFEDEYIEIALIVTGVDRKIVKFAKQIDKRNYSKDCFCIEVVYLKAKEKFCVKSNGKHNVLMYIDNVGTQRYIPYDFSNEEKKNILSICKKAIVQWQI